MSLGYYPKPCTLKLQLKDTLKLNGEHPQVAKNETFRAFYVSHNLNCLKEGFFEDYIGTTIVI